MPAFKSHSTATVDQAWDGPANKARVRSGEKRAYYGRIFAWYDPQGDEGVKETYKFVHHEVAADGTPGAANTNGCSAGIAVLNGGRGGSNIPAADREGVHAHLARHLKDAKKEVPPLKGQGEVDHPLLTSAFFGKCWAILPAKLDEMVALAESLLDGKKIDWPEAAKGKGGAGAAEELYQIQDGVALVRVYGVLDKRMNLFSNISGGTSYELLGSQIKQALADPAVQAILLDVDSPGGSVDGIKALADQIIAARGQKPILAFGNGQMTSAAYWIGAAADKVMADDTTVVGSIGTRMVHRDLSVQDAQKGIKRTVIYSGRYKNVGSDAGPLSPEDHAVLQGISDTYYQLFLRGVARARGQDIATVHQEMGDGRMFVGQQARDAGLIDQIGNLDDALALAKQMALKQGKGGSMDRKTLESQHPEVFAEIFEAGGKVALEAAEQTGFVKGTEAERVRVMEILEAGGDAAITIQAIRDGTAPAEAVKLLLKAAQEGQGKALADLGTAAPPLVGQPPPKVETHTDPERDKDAPIETRAKANWDKDSKLQKEFGGLFETYLAYFRAKEKGQVTE